jgi:hypothetical protein
MTNNCICIHKPQCQLVNSAMDTNHNIRQLLIGKMNDNQNMIQNYIELASYSL